MNGNGENTDVTKMITEPEVPPVPMEGGEPLPGPTPTVKINDDAIYDMFLDKDNIALGIKEEDLVKIGNMVVEEYDIDKASMSVYDERKAKWRSLFIGFMETKDFPWEDASNVNTPLLSEACLQFQARAYEALLPSQEIVKAKPMDSKFKDEALRVQRYMDYQLLEEMEEWEPDMDKLLLALPLIGVLYKKTYYSKKKGRIVSELLTPDEFITNYRCKRLQDAERKTHPIWMPLNDIKINMKDGIFIDNEQIRSQGNNLNQNTTSPEYTREADRSDGQEEPADITVTNRRIILEQHRFLDINYDVKQSKILEQDGIERPYIVWVDYESRKVLRISSPQYVDQESGNVKTFDYFTDYPFIPNPDSHYAYGFGHFLDHLNQAANSIVNQLIDSGTLNNLQGGFVSRRGGMKRGVLSFKMGEFKEVDIMADDIRKGIYEMQFKAPSNVLFNLLGMIRSWSKELVSVSEWMSGKLPPSDTAATTMLAIIEQGLKVFSSIQKRCHRSFHKELRKIYILNSCYLDEKLYYDIQDSGSGEFKTLSIGKNDFLKTRDIKPTSDPNITSRAERMIKAQTLVQEVKTNPVTANDIMAIYEATREYLVIVTGDTQVVDRCFPKPKPPSPPPDLPPQEENAGFIREISANALPQQDHRKHLFEHQAFLESVWGEQMEAQGKNLAKAHMKDHMAFLYLQGEQERAMMQQAGVSA